MNIQKQFEKAIECNDFNTLEFILEKNLIDPSQDDNWAIESAAINGYFKTVQILLNDKRVDPTQHCNIVISDAYIRGFEDIVDILWKYNKVQETLKKDDSTLYELLSKKYLQKNIESF